MIPDIETLKSLVLAYDAPDQTTAEVVCASLQAAGITAFVQNESRGPASGMLPYLGQTAARGVLVPEQELAAALALLETQTPTEEELIALMEADETSLAEAEARVR